MRVCPKCGYKDLLIWRHVPWRLFTDYCTLSELENWDCELAKLIKDKRNVKLLGYIYHLTKSQHVDRIHETDSVDGQSYLEPPKERRSQFIPMNQSRLLEEKP